MSDEWFKDKKDLDAAAKDFYDILEGVEKGKRKKLVDIFLSGFL